VKKTTPWIAGGVAVALITAGTIYAMQADDRPVDASFPMSKNETSSTKSTTSARITVPQGTAFSVSLGTGLSTKTAVVGDGFSGTLASPVSVDGRVAIPAGAAISGHVVMTEQPGKASGRGQMQLSYDKVTFGGHSYDMGTTSQVYESKSGTKKDVALIGGGAVAGGVVGGVLGGKGDIGKGAAVGAGAGTAASLLTRGPQLTIEQGTVLNATFDEALSVRRS
jgi:hypothetical protein